MGGILEKLANLAGGGLVQQIGGLIKDYWPPEIAPEKKAQFQLEMERLANERQKAADDAAGEAERAINDRIAIYEGTASDLKSIPVLGPLMLFLRGGQRIVIGYATVYLDYEVFSGAWKIDDPTLKSAFWITNFLVLGFLFGERALKNVAPLITDMLKAKS